MEKIEDFCRICLRIRSDIKTIFHYQDEKYLPGVIYNISGVKISKRCEPDAQICSSCTTSILAAECIIFLCQETEEFLLSERKTEYLSKNNQPKDFHNTNESLGHGKKVADSKVKSKVRNLDSIPTHKNVLQLKPSVSELSFQVCEGDSIQLQSIKNESFTDEDTNNIDEQIRYKQYFDADIMSDNSCAEYFEPHSAILDNCSNFKSKPVAEIKPKLKKIPIATEPNLKRKFEKQLPFMHKCEFCEFETVVRKCFINHLLIDHDIDDSNIYPCTLCAQKFAWRRLLFRHIEQDHKQQPVEKKFMCDKCGKAYTQEVHLFNHRKQQHGSECHKCPHPGCKSNFNRVSSLRRHFNNIHSGVKRFYCDTCDKYFSVWDNWSYHMDVVHQNTKISCPKCFSPFRNQKNLQKHIRVGACKNWMFHCEYCKRRFPSQTGWKVHEKSMHQQEAQLGKEPLTAT